MEIVELSDVPKEHRWLEWLGFQEPPPEPDTWVPVVRGLDVSDLKSMTSEVGARLVDLLGDAGIHARQRSYEFYAQSAGFYSGHSGTRVAVLVHARDRGRAIAVAVKLNHTIEDEGQKSSLSAEELTRQALAAIPPS